MLTPPQPYFLREMEPADIPDLMKIENRSFPKPWKAKAYLHELTRNKLASYQVVTVGEEGVSPFIVGYTGHWLLADEIHISTIATHPAWRGKHLGELLLLNTLFLAYAYSEPPAILVTLEVRPSNSIARNLYSKYRFQEVGRRIRYYQNKEDALIMTAEPLDESYNTFIKGQWVTLKTQLENG